MKARFQKYVLSFKQPSGTSRGILTQKETWFIILEQNGKKGIGECGLLRGLSADDRPDYEEKLRWVCENIELGAQVLDNLLADYPSIRFGLETAFLSLSANDPFVLFPSGFTNGANSIPINGLVWMGTPEFMKSQIQEKLNAGFDCIKLKIGAINFDHEIELLRGIREEFSAEDIEIRVDANGAFSTDSTLDKLMQLSGFLLHSIEQPIKPKLTDKMAELCKTSPIPIALDEELIRVSGYEQKEELLGKIRPQYIILKPSLLGGFRSCLEWIEIAERMEIGWWITSALESNIGLNAISQWTFTLKSAMHQGLGTGALYTNNIDSPLEVSGGNLYYRPEKRWNFKI